MAICSVLLVSTLVVSLGDVFINVFGLCCGGRLKIKCSSCCNIEHDECDDCDDHEKIMSHYRI